MDARQALASILRDARILRQAQEHAPQDEVWNLLTRSKSLAGRHSIRINDQWRIVFRWAGGGPEGVEIVDYH
jgi:plasmid maintenance system killer protein